VPGPDALTSDTLRVEISAVQTSRRSFMRMSLGVRLQVTKATTEGLPRGFGMVRV
jgi:hypothetical protein